METGRIQPIEFLIDYLRPENLANLQTQLDFIEQISPMIAKLPSITAQDAYIRKLGLRNFLALISEVSDDHKC